MSESNDLGRIGPYQPIRQLGIGGQGEVYLAETDQGLRVAVKLLHRHLLANERALSRFLREMEIAKRVAPFCTAQLLDTGESGDRPYIVSEYVEGPSLRDLVARGKDGGPRKGAALERLALNTVAALAGIHRAGVVHRDFNPDNVLLGPEGPVVIDFGIARALDLSQEGRKTNSLIGTPGFMAPEQIENTRDIGREADMFAWGATMVFAATGKFSFSETSLTAPLHEEPDLHGLDGRLGTIVRRCLDKDPTVRPTSAEVDALLRGQPAEGWISGLPSKPGTAEEPPPDDRPSPDTALDDEARKTSRANTINKHTEEPHDDRRKRRPLLIGAAVLTVLVILGVIGYVVFLADQDERHPSVALPGNTSHPPGESPPPKHKLTGEKPKQPSAHKTPSTRTSSSPRKSSLSSDGGAQRAKSGRKTIGDLTYGDGDGYCMAKGYYYGGEPYPGGQVVCYGSPNTDYRADEYSPTAVCRWKYPNHENVRADGSTCTASE